MDGEKESVKKFAERVGASPQLVYYYLRSNDAFKATETECDCGRGKVLIVSDATKIWDSLHRKGGET